LTLSSQPRGGFTSLAERRRAVNVVIMEADLLIARNKRNKGAIFIVLLHFVFNSHPCRTKPVGCIEEIICVCAVRMHKDCCIGQK